jgi:cytochrome c biogenesis protein
MFSPSRAVTLRQSVALVWRTLRSMRTALVLLGMLAGAAVIGSLIPQVPNSEPRVVSYLRDHRFFGDLFLRIGFFDVFGSWWFRLIAVLLFTSLVMCLLPRTRAALRAARQRPLHAREIDSFPQYAVRNVSADPEIAIERSRKALRRKRFRVDRSGFALAAEKGSLRELGSLLFHWSLLVILVGAVYGKGTGYSGYAVVVEGQTFTDAAANYDQDIRYGSFFSGHFTGAQIKLTDFSASFDASATATGFVSHVDLLNPDGAFARTADVSINHPANFDGLRIFQFAFGWAPVVEVRQGGRVLYSGPVLTTTTPDPPPKGVPQLALPWQGVVKLPSAQPVPVGIQLELWPDTAAFIRFQQTGVPQVMTRANAPFIQFQVWSGPLIDPSIRSLDTSPMDKGAASVVGQGQVVDLTTGRCVGTGNACEPDAGDHPTISFPSLRQYSVFLITRDPGVPIVLLGAILILLGLLPALYTSRRKVWIRAEPSAEGTTLRVGGFALQRKMQFEEEFAKLVADLEDEQRREVRV